jgi:hypothetical protein
MNGFEQSVNFDYRFLRNKREQFDFTIADTAAATAANYGVVMHILSACVIEQVWESHKTAGSDAGAVTLDIEKLGSGVALDSGTTVLSTALSLKTTANTPQQGTLSTDITKRQFAAGDRIALKDAGTLTAVASVTVSIIIRYRN